MSPYLTAKAPGREDNPRALASSRLNFYDLTCLYHFAMHWAERKIIELQLYLKDTPDSNKSKLKSTWEVFEAPTC